MDRYVPKVLAGVWPYGTAGAMILNIYVLFQQMFVAIFLNLTSGVPQDPDIAYTEMLNTYGI